MGTRFGFTTLGVVACVITTLLAGSAMAEDGGVDWAAQGARWSADRANAWYSQQPWYVGANFTPSTASNQFEMWQPETWDPETIDRELGWAAAVGYNGMRVFLHDMLWKADPEGFEQRIEDYLAIADKHGIRTMLVLFDSVWNPRPHLGPQEDPVPGVHNSRWVQSPHIDIQQNPERYEELHPYVTAILSRFKDDDRVYAWDLLNEPGNPTPQYEESWTREEKEAAHVILLGTIFEWARAVDPAQPLTAGIWVDPGGRTNPAAPLDKLMGEQSDIITFHTYGRLPAAKKAVTWLQESGRPIICTEYMARSAGSTFQAILPYFHEQNVGAMNWGLVNGLSQTIYPWHSWDEPFTEEPDPWFHDVFRQDGTPYDPEEAALIQKLTQQAPETETVRVEIDTAASREPISPYVYGQFIEHLGRCIYGGIWAEMLEDRKFYYPIDGKVSGWDVHTGNDTSWEGEGVPYEILVASPWQIIGPPEAVAMRTEKPFTGEQDPIIALDGSVEPRGIFHPRLGLEEGHGYTGYLFVQASEGVERVEVALQWSGGEDVVQMAPEPGALTRYPFALTAGATTDDGRLAIRAVGTGEVRIGTVSLMPVDNVDGFRADTLALMRQLDAPVYRWPGGNFVSGYDWRDGIGDRDRRPPRKNPAWTGIEHNDVGVHEFMRLCELLETEPFVALNTGLGDVSSAAAEVEYITGAADTAEGARRAENGHPDPWPARWWAVGNEMYGNWQLGHMPLEEYVEKHNAVVEAIRAVSPEARCIAVGSAGEWSETMLTHCADHMDLISEHLYWQRKDDVTEHVDVAVRQIEHLAKVHRGYRDGIAALDGKDIRIALDEWNYWYGPNIYGELGVRYHLRDALGCAAALHAMFRNSDLFFMANYAQTVNVIGAIKTMRTGAFLAATGQVLALYRAHFGTAPVPVKENLVGFDAAAAWSDDHATLTVALVNTRSEVVTADLQLAGVEGPSRGWRIQNDDPDAFNSEHAPEKVIAVELPEEALADAATLPPFSITLYQFSAGK